MAKVSKKISWEISKKAFLSILTFAGLIIFYVFYDICLGPKISEQLHQNIRKYIAPIFIINIAFILQKIIGGAFSWYKENVTAKTSTHLDDKLIPLLRRAAKIAVWIISLLIILPIYGINISALVATLGISSLAIALAAQDTIANIISGVMIMVDKPFRIGDKIKLPSGEDVEVVDIGVRRSIFLSADKAIIIVPNLALSKSKLVNYAYGEERG